MVDTNSLCTNVQNVKHVLDKGKTTRAFSYLVKHWRLRERIGYVCAFERPARVLGLRCSKT